MVDTKARGYSDWTGKKLVNLLHRDDEVNVSNKGFVELKAPSRGISIYVPVDKLHEQ